MATNFYKILYTVPNQEHVGPSKYKREEGGGTPKFLIGEVLKILKFLKNGKVAGPDKMENTTLTILAKALTAFLTTPLNQFLKEGFIPKQEHVSEIILPHKKGNGSELDNYRLISITSNVSKVFLKLLNGRIYPVLNFHQPIEQIGFRQGFSTLDHIFAPNQLTEKVREYKLKTVRLFIDYDNAFDSIYHRDCVWKALAR